MYFFSSRLPALSWIVLCACVLPYLGCYSITIYVYILKHQWKPTWVESVVDFQHLKYTLKNTVTERSCQVYACVHLFFKLEQIINTHYIVKLLRANTRCFNRSEGYFSTNQRTDTDCKAIYILPNWVNFRWFEATNSMDAGHFFPVQCYCSTHTYRFT